MKFKAPADATSISVGGETFNVDETGHVKTPDHGDYAGLLAPHGYTPVAEDAPAQVEPEPEPEPEAPVAEETAAEAAPVKRAKKAA
jgi:hypothetical protein